MSASWPAWTQDNLAAKPLHIHPFEYLSQQPYNSISRWTATNRSPPFRTLMRSID
jgi:hypothetical protein